MIKIFSSLSWACTQACTLAAFYIPSNSLESFKAQWRHLIIPIFNLSFWLSSWLPQLILRPHAATMQKQLTLIVFRKFPGDRPSLLRGYFQGVPHRSNRKNRDASFGDLQTQDGYVTAVFHSYMVLRLMHFTVPEDIVRAEWDQCRL